MDTKADLKDCFKRGWRFGPAVKALLGMHRGYLKSWPSTASDAASW